MAAPLGFKTFTTGEVLTAADTNGYLMQGVLVFANAAARTAAITSPQEGQASYLKDTDEIQVYSGSAWVTKSGSLPSQTGNAGKYLTTNGTDASWAAVPSSAPTSGQVRVNTAQSTSSSSYAALATAQSVTVTTGTKVMVIVSCGMDVISQSDYYASYSISGATTLAASDFWCVSTGADNNPSTSPIACSTVSYQTVTAGSNTFTMLFRTSSGTGQFRNRQLIVIDLGS